MLWSPPWWLAAEDSGQYPQPTPLVVLQLWSAFIVVDHVSGGAQQVNI